MEELSAWTLKAILMAALAIVGWWVKKDKDRLLDYGERLIKLESETVTEVRTREIFKDEIHPVVVDIRDMKGLLEGISKEMIEAKVSAAEQHGYLRALHEKEEKH